MEVWYPTSGIVVKAGTGRERPARNNGRPIQPFDYFLIEQPTKFELGISWRPRRDSESSSRRRCCCARMKWSNDAGFPGAVRSTAGLSRAVRLPPTMERRSRGRRPQPRSFRGSVGRRPGFTLLLYAGEDRFLPVAW